HLFKSRKEDFEIDERTTEKSKIKLYYIRNIINRPPHPVSSTVKSVPEKNESVIVPSPGNKITADDVKKNQIRITKDLKALLPTKPRKVKVVIKNAYVWRLSFRENRSRELRLGKQAAVEHGLSEGASIQLKKVDEFQ